MEISKNASTSYFYFVCLLYCLAENAGKICSISSTTVSSLFLTFAVPAFAKKSSGSVSIRSCKFSSSNMLRSHVYPIHKKTKNTANQKNKTVASVKKSAKENAPITIQKIMAKLPKTNSSLE
jgi:hypothetical protein